MSPRERVLVALSHKEPDRVPVDLGATENSSIHIDAYNKLKKHLGMKENKVEFISFVQQSVIPEEEILEMLGVDTRNICIKPPKDWELTIREEEDSYWFIDEWGVKWKKPKHGYYFDMVEHPLENATIKDLDDYSWPDPDNPGRYEGLEEDAKKLFGNTEYAIVGNHGIGSEFELNWYFRGFEKFLTDMVINPKFIEKLLAISLEIQEKIISKFLDIIGSYIQVLSLDGDIAMQTGPLMSPDLYKRLLKPYYKRLVHLAKSRTDAKIVRHCCGSIIPFLLDFIECGTDAIHPVQVSAKDMDTKKLKEKFGDKISFWGGIDTRHVLPYGTVEDVEKEVKRRIHDLAPGGGYVLAAVHNIQRDVPPENIVAMLKAAKDYGKYPIKLN
jgi:uroporphyrinogen decarboxylase